METRILKRQQRTVGSLVKIPLEDGFWTYARILETRLAFYDARTDQDLTIEEIIEKPILFFASVYDSAITKGYWQKIGKKLPLEEKVLNTPPVYTQDILNPSQFTIYQGETIRPATQEECVGLETLATWSYSNIEERLNDYYANRYNEFTYFMLNADMYGYYHQNLITK